MPWKLMPRLLGIGRFEKHIETVLAALKCIPHVIAHFSAILIEQLR
jgi:hypothetical protein